MRKVTAGLFISLDGVVDAANAGGWLLYNDEMDQIINAGLPEADAILMGRRTYLEFAQMWPARANDTPMAAFLNNTPKYVVSSTLTSLEWANSTLVTGDLHHAVARLKQQPGKNIQVPGSPSLIRSLLREGLLDQLSLMLHPVVLGAGLRLFDETIKSLHLQLVGSRTLKTGVVSLTYRPAGD